MKLFAAAITLCLLSVSWADSPGLKPDLAGVGFLVGRWQSGEGKVAETGGSSRGLSVVTVEAGGGALLRRDHVDLFDAKKAPAGGFDVIMLIYPDAGGIHADYSDGQHVIHYTNAAVVAGKSVTFTSAPQAGAPTFELSYALQGMDSLIVTFGMIPPGQTEFRPIATGTQKRQI